MARAARVIMEYQQKYPRVYSQARVTSSDLSNAANQLKQYQKLLQIQRVHALLKRQQQQQAAAKPFVPKPKPNIKSPISVVTLDDNESGNVGNNDDRNDNNVISSSGFSNNMKSCLHCGVNIKAQQDMDEHMESNHPDKMLNTCEHCGTYFHSIRSQARHKCKPKTKKDFQDQQTEKKPKSKKEWSDRRVYNDNCLTSAQRFIFNCNDDDKDKDNDSIKDNDDDNDKDDRKIVLNGALHQMKVNKQSSSKKLRSEDNEQPSEELRGIARELECPVCFNVAKPPIYQCEEGHLICCQCKPNLKNCPSCKKRYSEPAIRNRFAEDIYSTQLSKYKF